MKAPFNSKPIYDIIRPCSSAGTLLATDNRIGAVYSRGARGRPGPGVRKDNRAELNMDFREMKGERLRRVLAVVAIAVTAYYLWWRITETFNPHALLFSWLLWSAELFGFVTTALFYFTVWRPVTRDAPPPLPGRTVDVFVPTKNEPVEVLRKTLLACNDLKYPHRTLVLDDGGRDEVRLLCEELECDYLARPFHRHAKAGNLNYGLDHSSAEFIAVFDADHAPLPWFIDRLIGYFENEDLGFAQAPQEFYNVDSFQHRIDREKRYIWAEQGLFYGLIQPGRDRWNAAYFVGSCALLRRRALDDIGGFATQSITEDMLTSIRLHAEGWDSIFHDEPLAYGIAAETIVPFHIQRRRWGLGGWQVFFRANPLFVRGLSLSQRLCYLASLIYPFEGFQKLIFYITPPIALFTGILPMDALDINYLLHFVPYYAISTYAFNEMGRGFGGHLLLEQFSMGKFVTYMSSLWAFILPKRMREFTVTPKRDRDGSSYRLLAPQIAVVAASVAAVAWALALLAAGRRSDEFIIAVNSLWALYNTGLGIAIIAYARRKFEQRRADFRVPDSLPVFYAFANGHGPERRMAVADDITGAGLSLVTVGKVPTGRKLDLEMVLPRGRVVTRGYVTNGRTVKVNGHSASRLGVTLNGIHGSKRDRLSRYLTGSAVSKFLCEYSTRYETYLERRLNGDRKLGRRAPRVRALLPVVIHKVESTPVFGTMRNVSGTGCLLASGASILPGTEALIHVMLGEDVVELTGTAARIKRCDSVDFPETLTGIRFAGGAAEKARFLVETALKMEGLRR